MNGTRRIGVQLIGTADGSTVSFTFPSSPVHGTECVYVDGVRLYPGTDYQKTGTAITFAAAPPSGRPPIADYDEGSWSATQPGTDTVTATSHGGGAGDVVGPGSATDGNVVLFDGATGKLIKDSTYLGTSVYRSGGTDVALADGGTGASLADPGADRILFWDDSAGATDFLTAGSGLSISGTTLTATAASTILMYYKSADESVTSSAVLQNDDHLTFAVGTGETWAFDGILYVSGATGGDFQMTFSNPSLATLRWGAHGPTASTAFDSAAPETQGADEIEVYGGTSGTINYGTNGTTNPVTIIFAGSCVTTINSGSVTLQWAQRVSSGTATTVYAHSWLRAMRVS